MDSQGRNMTSPPAGSLAAALRADRLALGLDQAQVAEQIGINQAKLSVYELGKIKHPPPDRLVALAKLYGKPEDHYLSMATWLRVEQPREGMAELTEIAASLPDDEFVNLLDLARRYRQRLEGEENPNG